jgi:hypothetical protein
LNDSGQGNRDSGSEVSQRELPNWCDPGQPAWNVNPYSTLFADLYRTFTGRTPASNFETAEDLLVSGLAPDDLAVLVPVAPEAAKAIGVRAASDGKAWFAAPQPGGYRLYCAKGSPEIRTQPTPLPRKPGYDYVERVSVAAPKTSR